MAIDAVYNEGVKILYRSVKFLYMIMPVVCD